MAEDTLSPAPTTPPPPLPPPGQEPRKLWLWRKATDDSPAAAETATASATASATEAGQKRPPSQAKISPNEFHANFPIQQEGEVQTQHGGYPGIWEVLKTIKLEDFVKFAQIPCARDGMLSGITTGTVVGGFRYVMRGSPIRSAHWAVASFCAGGIASFEYCQWKRRQERVMMKRTVEVYQETMQEKRRREAELLQKQQEEERRLKEEASRRAWYRFW